MAQIAPFAGIHYAPARVPIAAVIAPPYDVISPAQQDALYARHPQNIVRLILNKEEPGDDARHNRYTRAAAFLRDGLAHGALVQDDAPALYEYVQQFEHPLEPERLLVRRALFVALRLEPYENGVVLPHEETHPKAKADRLELMRATRANPEPIFGLYEDPAQTVANRLEAARGASDPMLMAIFPGQRTPDAEQHLLYRHTDSRLLADIAAFFAPRRVWIADGHHRYETALNYQREQGDGGGQKPSDYLLIGLSAFEDPGLVILPTHRLVKNLPAARLEQLALQLDRYFHVQTMPTTAARAWIKRQTSEEKRFALLLPQGKAYALTLRDLGLADAALDNAHCAAWRHLDVTILQALVLDRTLGISWAALAHTPDVAYTRDEEEAVQKVQSGEYQLACLLQNPTVTEVRDVAAAGDKMPQKSTFFYPKLWSGLILRSLE
ncbi:MAG TPA: DUF1015 domain-containing protein [Chthonomonadaceae bacterium]|nr:DUF1015 domain-containing protein [Chthonomonadaceae bacterium]